MTTDSSGMLLFFSLVTGRTYSVQNAIKHTLRHVNSDRFSFLLGEEKEFVKK